VFVVAAPSLASPQAGEGGETVGYCNSSYHDRKKPVRALGSEYRA